MFGLFTNEPDEPVEKILQIFKIYIEKLITL